VEEEVKRWMKRKLAEMQTEPSKDTHPATTQIHKAQNDSVPDTEKALKLAAESEKPKPEPKKLENLPEIPKKIDTVETFESKEEIQEIKEKKPEYIPMYKLLFDKLKTRFKRKK